MKFSRFLRSIFGNCGEKSVEKTLVEDEKDGNTDYFSSSGLDSDSAYSSEEKGSKNGELQYEFQEVTDDIKQELQVAYLKRELTETTEEKEAEKMISDLKMEAETLNGENSKLLQELVTEYSQLREKLGKREKELASHTEIHETHKSETSGEIEKQKADELSSLLKKLEEKEKEDEDEKDGNTDYSFSFSSSDLDSDSAYSSKEKGSKNGKLQNEFQKLTETTKENEAKKMVSDLKMEAETLNGENSKLLQELVTECSQLKEKLGKRERELASHTEIHETHKSETSARMRGLELKLDSLRTQKRDKVKLLMENLSTIEEDYGYIESLVYEILNVFQGAKNRVRELKETVEEESEKKNC
ncbi:unnamed protein product [Camellia sinensis]